MYSEFSQSYWTFKMTPRCPMHRGVILKCLYLSQKAKKIEMTHLHWDQEELLGGQTEYKNLVRLSL